MTFEMAVHAYYSSVAELANSGGERDIAPNSLSSDPFYPVIASGIPPNTRDLVEIERADLKAVIPGKAFVLDQGNEIRTLREGDEVYLGYVTRIDPEAGRIECTLNKGGIIQRVELKIRFGPSNQLQTNRNEVDMTRIVAVVVALLVASGSVASAQTTGMSPAERKAFREYTSPQELVSIAPTTSMDKAFAAISEVSQKFVGKVIIDPERRTMPINIDIQGTYWREALERSAGPTTSGTPSTKTTSSSRAEPAQMAASSRAGPRASAGR